jgi:hypothetical protein
VRRPKKPLVAMPTFFEHRLMVSIEIVAHDTMRQCSLSHLVQWGGDILCQFQRTYNDILLDIVGHRAGLNHEALENRRPLLQLEYK